jgi:hypothetical protein
MITGPSQHETPPQIKGDQLSFVGKPETTTGVQMKLPKDRSHPIRAISSDKSNVPPLKSPVVDSPHPYRVSRFRMFDPTRRTKRFAIRVKEDKPIWANP